MSKIPRLFLPLAFVIALSGICTASDGLVLNALSRTSGAPGETFEMRGSWGSGQGSKIPCINRGGMNRLEVVSWSDTVILVRIPENLGPGMYKVGVYSSGFSEGASVYSSGWMDFEVLDRRGQARAAAAPVRLQIAGQDDLPLPDLNEFIKRNVPEDARDKILSLWAWIKKYWIFLTVALFLALFLIFHKSSENVDMGFPKDSTQQKPEPPYKTKSTKSPYHD